MRGNLECIHIIRDWGGKDGKALKCTYAVPVCTLS